MFDEGTGSSTFTVYEDDGTTTASPSRRIPIEARRDGRHIIVTVCAADIVPGLAARRPLVVEIVSAASVSAVSVDGTALPAVPVLQRGQRGWTSLDIRTTRACVPDAEVTRQHTFSFEQAGPAPILASLLSVSDRAFTDFGENVYARFSRPVQTLRGPLDEIKLDPSLTYSYMYPQPPVAQRNCPMWTVYLDEMIPNQQVELTLKNAVEPTSPLSTPTGASAPMEQVAMQVNSEAAFSDPDARLIAVPLRFGPAVAKYWDSSPFLWVA